jgi:NDP-sugar pyrophosphorylase family protein
MSENLFETGIIAAGEGLRLKNEGIKVSKSLVTINGKPLIGHLLEALQQNHAGSITCIINEFSQDLKEYLTNYEYPAGLNVIIKTTPNSFRSLCEISPFLKPPFLLGTCDSIFRNQEFSKFIEYCLNNRDADAVFAVTGHIDDEKPLYALMDKNNRLTGLSDTGPAEYVTGGLYFFNRDIRNEAAEAAAGGTSRLRYFLKYLLEKDFRIFCYSFSKIIDVDHVNDITAAEEFLEINENKGI